LHERAISVGASAHDFGLSDGGSKQIKVLPKKRFPVTIRR
jgi:hypothetical protein